MVNKIPSGSTFLDPKRILNTVDIKLGDRVADLGCGGAGYFVLQAARMVGDKGVAYGVDILKSALSGLESRADLDNLGNVVPVWSNAEIYGGAKAIKNDTLDIALLIQLLSQAKKHKDIFRETHRLLKKGGRAVVVDWLTSDLSFGPKSGQFVPIDQVKALAHEAGFKFAKSFQAGPYHYGLIFEKI